MRYGKGFKSQKGTASTKMSGLSLWGIISCLLNKSLLRLIPTAMLWGPVKTAVLSRFYRVTGIIHCVFFTEYLDTR